MPNLNTDRAAGVALAAAALNVRRLMYQSLIWFVNVRDHSRGMRPAFDAQDVQGSANTLVDSVRRDAELDRNLLRGQMLVDQEQAIELALAKLGDTRGADGVWLAGG